MKSGEDTRMSKQNKQQASGKGFGKGALLKDIGRVNRDLQDANFLEIYKLVYDLQVIHGTHSKDIQSCVKKGYHTGYIKEEIAIATHSTAKRFQRVAVKKGLNQLQTLEFITGTFNKIYKSTL